MKALISTSLLCLSLTGCSMWPEPGRGGQAEQQLAMLAWLDSDQYRELGPEHGLRFEAAVSKNHLDLLILEGAELCFPASVSQARLREQRILRELEGGLSTDAAVDLEIQMSFLRLLETRLDAAKAGGACKPQQLSGVNLLSTLNQALNYNNQFAFNSAELTPAYRQHLSSLAPLLANQQLSLSITGHSDSVGSSEAKQSLAEARAKQVADFLSENGINHQRISLHASADRQPFQAGDSAPVRHSNRRVTISVQAL